MDLSFVYLGLGIFAFKFNIINDWIIIKLIFYKENLKGLFSKAKVSLILYPCI
jgi:hypothetical protein